MEGVLMCLGVCIHMCESHDTNYVTAKLEVTTGQTNKYILTSASDILRVKLLTLAQYFR